jgi:tetratricopeptide (TPR) repeat protein
MAFSPKDSAGSKQASTAKPAANFVPMTAEEFDRRRRMRALKWAGWITGGALFLGIILWVSSRPSTSRTSFEDADRLYREGKYQEALTAADEAVSNARHKFSALQLRSTIYRTINEPASAAADLSAMISIQPDDPDIYQTRAAVYSEMKEFEKAVADLNKVIAVRPSAKAFAQRGLCYRELGRNEEAAADLSKAVELSPTPELLMQRGMAYAANGKHDKAVADFDRAIEIRPNVPYTYRARAYSRDVIGDHAGAAADREKALSIEGPAQTAETSMAPRKKK